MVYSIGCDGCVIPSFYSDHWLASKNLFALVFHSSTIFPVYMIKGIQLLVLEEKIGLKVKRELSIGYAAAVLIISFAVLAGSIIGRPIVLQLWIVPAFIAQAVLALAYDWLPHHPHEEKAPYLNTRVIDLPGLEIILLGQNYRLIHHLHPRIPFLQLQGQIF